MNASDRPNPNPSERGSPNLLVINPATDEERSSSHYSVREEVETLDRVAAVFGELQDAHGNNSLVMYVHQPLASPIPGPES